MIAPCTEAQIPEISAIVNDAARAYRGHVPNDCLHEPYMPEDELHGEVAAGVRFWGWSEGGELLRHLLSLTERQNETSVVLADARWRGPLGA
jgi:hypothetical protein